MNYRPSFTRHRAPMTVKWPESCQGLEALQRHLKPRPSSDWIKRLEMVGGGLAQVTLKNPRCYSGCVTAGETDWVPWKEGL